MTFTYTYIKLGLVMSFMMILSLSYYSQNITTEEGTYQIIFDGGVKALKEIELSQELSDFVEENRLLSIHNEVYYNKIKIKIMSKDFVESGIRWTKYSIEND